MRYLYTEMDVSGSKAHLFIEQIIDSVQVYGPWNQMITFSIDGLIKSSDIQRGLPLWVEGKVCKWKVAGLISGSDREKILQEARFVIAQ